MECSIRVRREGGRDLPLLLWRPPAPMHAIASTPHGGGMGVRRWVLIAEEHGRRARRDLDHDLGKLGVSLGLAGRGVAMTTTGDVRAAAHTEDEGVSASVTLASDGRVSLVAFVPERLSEAALVNAVATATEAKIQALRPDGASVTNPSSDAICILCPEDGRPHDFGGPRSVWGSRLARAVHAAVLDSLASAPASIPVGR
jgi:adenosylcobinamide amidohydrolase